MNIPILYEDEQIIAVDKPPRVSTIPNTSTPREESLVGMLEERFERKFFVVHRLDKDTSGVIVFALDPATHRDLNIQFEQQKVEKKYIGIVEGKTDFVEKKISIPISKSKIGSKKVALSSKGFEAITIVKTLKNLKGYSIVEIRPVTGKRHQIRLHLKAIGHPLAIDELYGRKEPIIINGKIVLDRMPLHASEISFVHPGRQEKITISSEIPQDMNGFISSL
ncbi:MAG: RluA family pseudouridine synthase [Candidatus Saganbacteria bacterium]|nr:RluA family pseudouridine synthase [Candidatus Saganbacteria bacterium]